MASMKAAVVNRLGEGLAVEDVAVLEPGPGQVLVKLVATGVCHTDLHAADGDWPVKPTPPFIPGHEGVGEVVQVGEGVTDLQPGDMVGNAWLAYACGDCEFCRTGWETLCEEQKNSGYSVDGSFGQYMLVDASFAARIPEGADPQEIAPILCAGVTVYKGLKVSEARPGQWVVISGIGGLGHVAVQYAKAWACGWQPWTSPMTSWSWRRSTGPKCWSTHATRIRPRLSSRRSEVPTRCW